MRQIIAIMLAIILVTPVMSVRADDKWDDRYEVQITDTARVVLWQRGVGKTWYGSVTQGGQALVQYKRITRLTPEQVKLAWEKEFSHCPSREQIYEVQRGWDKFIIWAEQSGKYEEVVEILSTFTIGGPAPGPIVLRDILNAVSSGATAAIGGVFFERAMAAIRPSNIGQSQTVEGGGASASTAPVTAVTGPSKSYSASGATSGSVSTSGSVGGNGSVAGSGSVGGATGVNAGP